MATELWIRNPQRSVKYCIAEGQTRYIFDRALLNRYGRSAHTFMRENFLGSHLSPEFIVIGDQGAQHYDLFTPHDKPLAVWPTWNAATEDVETLEYLLANPPGEDPVMCMDQSVTPALRPVYGQPHRVFITGMKFGVDKLARKYARELVELCESYSAVVHVTEQMRFSIMFGIPWHSVDWAPDFASRNGVYLPNGVRLENPAKAGWGSFSDWIELLGYSVDQIRDDPYERTRFHIRSLRWAAENFTSDLPVRRRFSPSESDVRNSARGTPAGGVYTSGNTQWRKPQTVAIRALRIYDTADGDKLVCNECVLRVSCSLARADMVCALKGTEMGELSKYFGTRDADSIIDGLTKLVAKQADRLEDGMLEEQASGERDPEIRREIDSVFKNATALAKLINPNLNGKGTTVNNQTLNINGGAVAANDPRQIVASIVRELTDAGIPRDQITGEMLKTMLANGAQQQALEGVVVEAQSAKE